MKLKTRVIDCRHSCVFAYCPDNHENCACRTCLVKVMCVDSCDIRRDSFKLDYGYVRRFCNQYIKIKGE